MNSMTRYEHIKYFEKIMCSICHSKYCKGKIRVIKKNGITSIKCNEYNKTRKDQLK